MVHQQLMQEKALRLLVSFFLSFRRAEYESLVHKNTLTMSIDVKL